MDKSKYVVLVFMTATTDWLRLSRRERGEFTAQNISPILEKYAEKVTMRWLDAEAFTARCSDIALFETSDLVQYYFLMEELRDTAFFSQPYFRLEDVVISLEEGYQEFEAAQKS